MLHLAHPRAPRASRVVAGGGSSGNPLGRLEAIPRSIYCFSLYDVVNTDILWCMAYKGRVGEWS